jgi:O-antigen/teichoic acid export membrane protein
LIDKLKAVISRLLPKSRFAREVGVLAGGTVTAQLMGILAAPLLTRLYTPDDFGVFAVYTAICGMIGVVATLRYELAIPLQKDDRDAAGLVILCLIVALCITLVTAVGLIFFSGSITHLLKVPGLNGFLWVLPIGVFLTGAYATFNYWAIRNKEFPIIAQAKILRSSGALGTQIIGHQAHFAALVGGFIAGQVMETSRLGRLVFKGANFKNLSWLDIRKLSARYRRFPMFSTWSGLANTASMQLPPR